MKRYLAIDIGASSGRHIVGSMENGILVTEEVYRFVNLPEEREGRLYWNAEKLFGEIVNGLNAAAEKGRTPDYIGIDTWAVDYALLDENDDAVGGVFCYRDKRGAAAAEKVHKKVSFETLYERTGIQYQPFNTVYQLCDDISSGRAERAQSMLMLPDYFNFLLTGVKKQEYTNATSTGLVNAKTHTWDEEIISALGLDKRLFKDLSQPCTAVGALKKSIADVVGYNAVVLLPATHDTASAVLAAPIGEDGMYISSGTWSLLGVQQRQAHTDSESRKFNYSNEGSVDFGFRFQKNIMGLWMIQSVRKELDNKYSFALFAQMARENPTDILLDVNDERFLAPRSMIEEIKAAANGRLANTAQIAYCIFNSLAQCYKDSAAQLEKLTGSKYDIINIIGGGCNNELLNELTARACGKKVIAGPSESTAIGNLIAQMRATGEIKDLSQARQIVKKSFDIKEVGI